MTAKKFSGKPYVLLNLQDMPGDRRAPALNFIALRKTPDRSALSFQILNAEIIQVQYQNADSDRSDIAQRGRSRKKIRIQQAPEAAPQHDDGEDDDDGIAGRMAFLELSQLGRVFNFFQHGFELARIG